MAREPGCAAVVGDMGGDAIECFGCLGSGEPGGLSPGRGLVGNPGLSKGEAKALLFATMEELSEVVGLSMAFKEPAGGCRGESGRPAWRGLKWRGDSGSATICGTVSPAESSTGVDFDLPLLSLFFFADLLRASSSFRMTASRARSSSSRVLRRPLSDTTGISSTTRVSS